MNNREIIFMLISGFYINTFVFLIFFYCFSLNIELLYKIIQNKFTTTIIERSEIKLLFITKDESLLKCLN